MADILFLQARQGTVLGALTEEVEHRRIQAVVFITIEVPHHWLFIADIEGYRDLGMNTLEQGDNHRVGHRIVQFPVGHLLEEVVRREAIAMLPL
ncbi:Uncharacterised protein [Edwardsiella tarda]|nr:Uncharacterised protein [Edwardsiella tarda]